MSIDMPIPAPNRRGRKNQNIETPNSIRRRRLAAGLTLEQVGDAIGVSGMAVSYAEMYGTRLNHRKHWRALAKLFGMHVRGA